jgi:hypothetical protein
MAPVPALTATQTANLKTYADGGGRVLALRFARAWLEAMPSYMSVATWSTPGTALTMGPMTINTSFPAGLQFSMWLTNVNAASAPGQVTFTNPRTDFTAPAMGTQVWITGPLPMQYPQILEFPTPFGAAPPAWAGEVVYSEVNALEAPRPTGMTFPAECSTAPLTPQEHVLEYMLFELLRCT